MVEDGVQTESISVKVLYFDEATTRAPTFMIKFNAGASNPNNNRPAGEEVEIF